MRLEILHATMADEDPMEFLNKQREMLAAMGQMNQVANLQNQLAVNVQQRMASIEKLLEDPAPDQVCAPDQEVEMWKARIRKLTEDGSSNSSSRGSPAVSTRRDGDDARRMKQLHHAQQRNQEPVHQQYRSMTSGTAAHSSRARPTAPSTENRIPVPLPQQPAQPRPKAEQVNGSGWYRAFDPKTGRPYLFNPETKETKWEVPRAKIARGSPAPNPHPSPASQNVYAVKQAESATARSRPQAPLTKATKPLTRAPKPLCMTCYDTDCKCAPSQRKAALCNVCFDIPCNC